MEEMDLNDTFGELNPSNLLNLDVAETETEAEPQAQAQAEVEVEAAIEADAPDTLVREPRIGMEFESDEAAKEFYTAYATRLGFSVRMNKSRRSRKDDTVIMRRFVCTKEGFHSKRVIYDDGKKKRKRATAREGCMAMIEVVKKDPHGKWYVSKLVTEHTHVVPALQMQSKPLSLVKADDGNDNNNNNSNNNVDISLGGSGLKSCYSNSGRVVRVSPFGEGGEGQDLLEYLKGRQARSPGFFYAVQVDNNNCMTNVFWADAKARMAYTHFRDAVTFDTTYKKTKYMMPFACFRGVNQHLQSVNFGCCLLMDETKGSYIWLFETWLSAMGGSHPPLLITDKDKAMEGAISRVFPNTGHKFCQSHILSRCKHKLSDAYLKHVTLKSELKGCVTGSGTREEFETRWEHLLSKYNLWDNAWLQSLYQIRDKWVNVCQKSSFFPVLFVPLRQESLNKFFKRNFNAKTSLLVFINCFDQDVTSRHEKEAQADFATTYKKPILKSPSPIEKQAAEVYTRAVFDIFQEEFVQSLGYFIDKVESDGQISRYTVAREEEEGSVRGRLNFVSIDSGGAQSSMKASCNCCMFEYSGILCRHVLRVFFVIGVRTLPREYILPRWTKSATTSSTNSSGVLSLNEEDGAVEEAQQGGLGGLDRMVSWYNELCRDGVGFGIEGSVSPEVYKIAKSALERAFAEVISEKDVQRKGQQLQQQQHSMSRFARVQKMQQQHQHNTSMPRLKVPLPKLQPKKTPTARAPLQEDTAA